jgi:hypothetical protein
MPSSEARSGHFLWVLVGQVAYACSQWAVLVVFSKLGSAQAVGLVAYGITTFVASRRNARCRPMEAAEGLGRRGG